MFRGNGVVHTFDFCSRHIITSQKKAPVRCNHV
nr:MAG TPA: hypothetical protein [Caudoviricetes sp.]